MMFDGKSGSPPAVEAKRYVYRVLAASLDMDLGNGGGWVFGGMDDPGDRKLARTAARAVFNELIRRGNK